MDDTDSGRSSMSDIHALVFSKRRPLQLDGFLRSCYRHAPYASITVVAVAGEGYPQCMFAHPAVNWLFEWGEGSFERMVRYWIVEHERVVFHTDDELYFRTPPADLLELDNSQVVLTLRQGRNTTYCHPLSSEQTVPTLFPWRWRDAHLDFAYPLSLNACIYNTVDLLPLLDFSFTNPTTLEAQLAANAARFQVELMTAPEHSCTVALPHNVTSDSSGNPRGANPEWQPDALLEAYLAGKRMDLDAMDFSGVNAAHVEVPLVLK